MLYNSAELLVGAGIMKEVYWEIKINKPGPRFLPELSLSGPAKVVYFDLPIYFLHDLVGNNIVFTNNI